MKKHFFSVIVAAWVAISSVAAPINGFKYQAVVRNNQGTVIENSALLLKVSILQGAENGTSVYSEQHEVTTNAFGLINVIIGNGTSPIGDFTTIDWSKDSYYLKVEMAIAPNTTLELLGVSPLHAVPYALHAETVANNNDADADPSNEIQEITLVGTTLSITQSSNSVDLSPLITADTDEQTLDLKDDNLSISNGNSVNLAPYKDNTDAQELTLTGTTLGIIGGNDVDLSKLPDQVNDADADPTNEIQDLTLIGSTLKITNNATATEINLAPYAGTNTDEQALYLAGDSLGITNGNKVWLPKQDIIWDTTGATLFYNQGNVGIGTGTPKGKLEVKGSAVTNPDEIIFGVLNNVGDTVFAVYQSGVRINIDDNGSKAVGSRGGFAVGGFSSGKGTLTNEYLRITPDSVRVYVNDDPTQIKAVGSRGGFAVGGFSSGKGMLTNEYLRVTPDSVRVYFDDSPTKAVGSRGGFAVGGFSSGKGEGTNYMYLEPDNYFIGQESGKNINNGLYNSFLGYQTGYSTTDASNNVFLGYKSGFSNTLGNSNVLIGYKSGFGNTIGYSNIFIGDSAGFTNTSGNHNVFIGNQSGSKNTIGNYNVASGYRSLFSNTEGNANVAFGENALYSNTIGLYNTASGLNSLYSNTTGSSNTANGLMALYSNSTANGNTAAGYQALYSNTTGNGNTAVGTLALWQTTNSNLNTALGYNSFITATNLVNSTALGANAQVITDNTVRIGDGNVLSINGAVGFSILSDGRFKTIAKADVKGLDFITRLNPVIYTFNTQQYDEFLLKDVPEKTRNEIISKKDYSESQAIKRTGFVAQDVEQAAIQAGFEFNGVHSPVNENDNYSIDYSLLTVPLVKAVQELNAKNEALQSEVDLLKAQLAEIKAMLNK